MQELKHYLWMFFLRFIDSLKDVKWRKLYWRNMVKLAMFKMEVVNLSKKQTLYI